MKINQKVELTQQTINSSKNDVIWTAKCNMNADLLLAVKQYPIVKTQNENGNIILEREIFVFSREELEEFINEAIILKQYKHEV